MKESPSPGKDQRPDQSQPGSPENEPVHKPPGRSLPPDYYYDDGTGYEIYNGQDEDEDATGSVDT
jgi:hypothetical protein